MVGYVGVFVSDPWLQFTQVELWSLKTQVRPCQCYHLHGPVRKWKKKWVNMPLSNFNQMATDAPLMAPPTSYSSSIFIISNWNSVQPSSDHPEVKAPPTRTTDFLTREKILNI
ncbi:uncharacterized protein LOC111382632 isoform X3 [Olea europaea var. sylvestris]|uniref:uncharacterized protein LOC111382632 isoform X3 n=1 Tax=Olea europaea var. sylvestris TaxID=158386 RepID=UPI000C1CE14D|nr:uncharacterized protein LOC111382632 isoform X3 [Olea europaea var. sylvestris]